jgi:glycine dehydrogenase subunit 1
MNVYIPNGDAQRRRMLEAIGVGSVEDLLSDIPSGVRLSRNLDLPPAASELELTAEFKRLEKANTGAGLVCFAGAGAYDHYIPAAIDHVLLRSEFFTAYTPYQAEASQGTLQAIFEYQTMIARLCGTEMANASMYDGATSAAEAALMAMRITGKGRVLAASTLNPSWFEVMETYLVRAGFGLAKVPVGADGRIDRDALGSMLGDDVAALVVQYPSYYGLVEDLRPLADAVHGAGGLLVTAADPVALAILRTPGSAGADVVVGEGQPLGIPMSYGGPYAGFMATALKLARKMPGRIIGRTVDRAGETGYVMTMQTREQHIRREKATSNICTNQALMALANTLYLSLTGEVGFREIARQCYHRSHYLERRLLEEVRGSSRIFPETPFFREFALRLPVPAAGFVDGMADRGILAGVPVPALGADAILITATEKRTREEIEAYATEAASLCREVSG